MISRKKLLVFPKNLFRFCSTNAEQGLDPVQEALLNEQCILVDENDNEIGQASKRLCHLVDPKSGISPLHRAFSLFIFNQNNELLMQQRSDTKITFPGRWTNTCCSHPLFFPEERNLIEGAKVAAQRKVFQELGIQAKDCTPADMKFITRIHYAAPSDGGKWAEHEIDYILFMKQKKADHLRMDPNPEEVKNVMYLKLTDLEAFIAEMGDKSVTPWFLLMAKTQLPKWWANLDNMEKFVEHENKIFRH